MNNKAYKSEVTIKFAGEGGQGLVTSAAAIAQAAAAAGYHIQTFSTFPSQIMGGPASSQVRISTTPVLSNGDYLDVLVALNKYAYDAHGNELAQTGVVIYNSADFTVGSSDRPHLGLDAQAIAKEVGNLRAENMALIGAVAQIIGFSLEHIEHYVKQRFTRGRPNDADIISSNLAAIKRGVEQATISGFSAGKLQTPNPPEQKQMIVTGNTAISLGAVAVGLDFYIGYPISPATTILVWMEQNLIGKGKFAYQASSEIEAINALVGAGFAGKKCMTATSGPGLSLMSEGIGLAWMAEIPCVIVDVQRGGPATGLPTKSEQSDLFACIHPAHGDIRLPIIAPGSVEECLYSSALALNWAERYQGPVMLLSEFSLSERAENIPAPDVSRLQPENRSIYSGGNGYKRYVSWDGNSAMPPMPIPGGSGAYVANGSEHDEIGDTTHLPKHHVRLTERRFSKLTLLQDSPYEIENAESDIVVMPWGSSKGPTREAYLRICEEQTDKIGWVYSLALEPLPKPVLDLLKSKQLVLVPELNYQGQWSAILRQQGVVAESITLYTGLPFRPIDLVEAIIHRIEKFKTNKRKVHK